MDTKSLCRVYYTHYSITVGSAVELASRYVTNQTIEPLVDEYVLYMLKGWLYTASNASGTLPPTDMTDYVRHNQVSTNSVKTQEYMVAASKDYWIYLPFIWNRTCGRFVALVQPFGNSYFCCVFMFAFKSHNYDVHICI